MVLFPAMSTQQDTLSEEEQPVKHDLDCHWREAMCKDLYSLQQTAIMCDITLLTAEDPVRAHKVVLATRVPYFKAMFTSTLGPDEVHTANLRQYKKTLVESVIKFVYTGKFVVDCMGTAIELFCLSDFLQIPVLRENCEDYIFSNITESSAVDIANVANSFSSMINLSTTWQN